jgi:DNA adenine methylase
LLAKAPAFSEVYNDLNEDLVSFFRVLRDPHQSAELCRLVALTPFARAEWKSAYEHIDEPIERARRLLLRSFGGFGSDSSPIKRRTGFRSNTNRRGTTPALDWSRYPAEIAVFCQRLQGVLIDCRPAIDVMDEHDMPDTLHYADPPYVPATRSEVRGYEHELTDQDHCNLADALHRLTGFVVISGYRCDLYDDLYEGWMRHDRETVIFRQSRRLESIWLSPKTSAALEGLLFR